MCGVKEPSSITGPLQQLIANVPPTTARKPFLAARVLDDGRPIAHVAAENGVAHSPLTEWAHCYHSDGSDTLEDHSNAPASRPSRLSIETIELTDRWRRDHTWSDRRIAAELVVRGIHCCVRARADQPPASRVHELVDSVMV